MASSLEQIAEFIRGDSELLAVTHFAPDGDAVGSLLAFGGMLDYLNIDHILAIDDELPKKYSFLPGAKKILNLREQPIERVYDRVAILDAGALPRIGSAQSCIGSKTTVLNIDHHLTAKNSGTINLIITSAAATAEILYDLCLHLNIEITEQIAYGLYVGILTDTGRFRFANTGPRAFEICGKLVAKGVNPGRVAENVYYNLPFEVIQALARVLLTLELHFGGLVCLISLDDGCIVSDTEGFVEYGSSIRGVAIAAFICEMEKQVYKVSLRSRSSVDVSEVASKFGGGGHLKAAGFRFQGRKTDLIEALLQELMNQIDAHKIRPGTKFIEATRDEGKPYSELMLE